MAYKVLAQITDGPDKLLGRGPRYADVKVFKARSTVSERATSYEVTPQPDGRFALTFEYRSGRSLGANNRGTVSARTYTRHRTEVVDRVEWTDDAGVAVRALGPVIDRSG